MKKTLILTLFSLFTISFSSCTGEDDGPSQGGSVKFKFDGVQKEHNICIVTQTHPQDGETVLVLTSSNTEEEGVFRYEIALGETGNVTPQVMGYQTPDNFYDAETGDYQTNVSINSSGHIKGTFSGTFWGILLEGEQDYVIITDGEFDVYY